MFGLFKKSDNLLSRKEKKEIVNLIQDLEQKTSGEIRIYIEGECPYETPMKRTVEIFEHLSMNKTQLRNGILLYIASESRVFSIYGDDAIYTKADHSYWQEKASILSDFFKKEQYAKGIESCLKTLGAGLAEHFPPTGTRKNELPDDIVFGKFN